MKSKKDKVWKVVDLDSISAWYSQREHLINCRFLGQYRMREEWGILDGCFLDGKFAGQPLYIFGVTAKEVKHRNQVVCHCSAYLFPHRAHGGKCKGQGLYQFALDSGACDSCQYDAVQHDYSPFGETTACLDHRWCRLEYNDVDAWLETCPGLDKRRKK